jgi:hypothetical protein
MDRATELKTARAIIKDGPDDLLSAISGPSGPQKIGKLWTFTEGEHAQLQGAMNVIE